MLHVHHVTMFWEVCVCKLDNVEQEFLMKMVSTLFRMLNRGGYRWRLVHILTITCLVMLVVTLYRHQSPELTPLSINIVKDSPRPIFKLLNRSETRLLEKFAKIWKENMYRILNAGQGKGKECKQMLRKISGDAYMVRTIADLLDASKRNRNGTVKDLLKHNIAHEAVAVSKEKQNMSLNYRGIVATKKKVDYQTLQKTPEKQADPIKQRVDYHIIPTAAEKHNVYHHSTISPVKQRMNYHISTSPIERVVERSITTVPNKQRVYSNTTSFVTVQQQVGSRPTANQSNGHNMKMTLVAKPKILLWFLRPHYQPIMKELHPLSSCPDARCRITSNWEYYSTSSALIFAVRFLTWQDPPLRLSNQVWILHNHESPRKEWVNNPTFKLPQWRGLFNWTMDYRKDADIVSPYGILKKRASVVYKNYSRIVSQKLGQAAWVVSNCYAESKRYNYVTEMMKHLEVKMFGFCGGTNCSRRNDECLGKINDYKFYLAFENAFCPDYLTEKFYRWYTADVVLVVRGGANYKRDLPKGTYINTADFPTVRDLASYLNYLDKHDDKYIDYLKEKDRYESVYEDYVNRNANGDVDYIHYHYEQVPLCEVCYRLWNLDRYKRIYDDIGRWFDQGLCYIPDDI